MNKELLGSVHHVGVVVENVEKAGKAYQELGFTLGSPEDDIHQKVRVLKIYLKDFMIELIEPMGKDSPVINFLEKGGGLNHFCYNVESIAAFEQYISENKLGRAVSACTLSVFEKRKIQFFYLKELGLIEVIEMGK